MTDNFEVQKKFMKRGIKNTLFLFSALVLMTIIIDYFSLDIKTASLFYQTYLQKWILDDFSPCEWLYRYGTIPGLIIILTLFALWISSFISTRFCSWRRDFLLCFLTIIIGGGIIANAVLKDNFGRPRPRQIKEFGGNWSYLPPLVPGIPGKGKSFPCGHCVMGFAPAAGLFLYYRSRKFALTSLGTGLIYGSLVSITRIGQGAHLLSDALWSLGIILLTGSILYYFVLKPRLHYKNVTLKKPSPLKLKLMSAVSVLGIVLMALIFLTRRPFYNDIKIPLEINKEINKIQILTNLEKADFFILDSKIEKSGIDIEVKGFGFPNAEVLFRVSRNKRNDVLYLNIFADQHGYFSEKNVEAKLLIPENLKENVKIDSIAK